MSSVRITLIGGPTALIEFDGFTLLDQPHLRSAQPPPAAACVTLTKLTPPALALEQLGPIDAVLLSHDQHADNLDEAGKAMLGKAGRVLTTKAGASRLGGHVEGLAPWDMVELSKPGGRPLRIAATPARHGPAGIEPLSGDVIGFVVTPEMPTRARSTSLATTSGLTALPRSQRASSPASSCRSPVRHAARTVPSDHGYQRRRRDRA